MLGFKRFDAKYRRYFSKLSGRSQGPLTIQQAATLFELPYSKVKYILNRLAKSGWLFRIKQGLYIPVPATIEDG
jgi:predicted transcriptional regulator of viral defense system